MLGPPLQELDCFCECRQASSRYRKISMPPLTRVRPEVEVSLHGAEVASSTQSTARLVEFGSFCRPVPLQG